MDLSYPSPEFPGPPALRLTVPDTWIRMDHPDAVAAAVDPASPPEFMTNLLVLTSRAVGEHTLEMLVDLQVTRALEQLGGNLEHQEHMQMAGRDSIWTAFTFPPSEEGGLPLFQVQATLLLPRVRQINDTVSLIGTCAAGATSHYAPLFRATFLSLAVATE